MQMSYLVLGIMTCSSLGVDLHDTAVGVRNWMKKLHKWQEVVQRLEV